MQKLLLVDGNAIIHRAFHALPPFTTSSGEITNAVYGFSSMLLTVLKNLKPDYIAVAFDKKGKTFRNEMYEDYKATRVKAPQTLYDQIPRIKEVVMAFDIPIFELEGYEADDIIGTLSTQAYEHADLSIYIATGDMDAMQLLNDRTFLVSPHKGFKEQKVLGPHDVMEKYGLPPAQLKDYKGLKGDTSDNIPGVRGIGDKGAVSLLQKYKSLEGIYEHIEEISGSTKTKLVEGKDQAFMSRTLGTILLDVPVTLKLNECKTHTFDLEKIQNIFQNLEFRSMQKRLNEFNGHYQEAKAQENGQQALF